MADGPPIPVGSRVRLKGLTGASYLNGAEGDVTGPPTSQPESDLPRYPIRLLMPRAAVAAHPQGVRVQGTNLDVIKLPDMPKLTKLMRSQPTKVPLTPENVGQVALAFVTALEGDVFPEEGLDAVFGVQMPPGGRDGTDGTDMRRCKIGQLVLGTWQELLQSLQQLRLGAAVQVYGGTQQELDFALMSASIGGLEALRVMGGAHGRQLAAVAETTRQEFMRELGRALRAGCLPQWFEGAVRRVATTAGSPSCAELCRRGFERVPWDREAHVKLKTAA